MYPKWLAKLDLAWYGQSALFRPVYVWKKEKRLSPHTGVTYCIFGAAELHAEAFRTILMRLLEAFGTRFDSVLTLHRNSLLDFTKMNPILKQPRPACAILEDERSVVVLTRGAHKDVSDRLGRDVKTWKRNQWLWDGLAAECFSHGVLSEEPNAALREWREQRPKPAFELKTEFLEFPSSYRLFRTVRNFCIYAALPRGSTEKDERAFELWLASLLEERGIVSEWYVTGNSPESAKQFFG